MADLVDAMATAAREERYRCYSEEYQEGAINSDRIERNSMLAALRVLRDSEPTKKMQQAWKAAMYPIEHAGLKGRAISPKADLHAMISALIEESEPPA